MKLGTVDNRFGISGSCLVIRMSRLIPAKQSKSQSKGG